VTRLCAYPPCSASFESSHPKARYCSDSCRAKDWKRKAFYGAARSVRTDGSSRSGPQVSLNKAVASVHHSLEAPLMAAGFTSAGARETIEDALRDALPARQRARLEARER